MDAWVLDRVYFCVGKEPRSTLPVQHVSGNQKLPKESPFLDDFVLNRQRVVHDGPAWMFAIRPDAS